MTDDPTPPDDCARPAPLRVFVSYAHEDHRHHGDLVKHLAPLERQGLIRLWSDRKLLPGDDFGDEIDRQLDTADLVLLLVSADFVASEYCWSREMRRAMERHREGAARVAPVIVRPCDWREMPFAGLDALPDEGRAVTSWDDPDAAWTRVAEGVRRLARGATAPAEDDSGGDPLRRYLEAVEAECSSVALRGMGAQVAERMPLRRVYTRLRAVRPGRGLEPDGAEVPAGEEALGDEGVRGAEVPERTAELGLPQVLSRDRHAVLVGDPGSGKTTFLRFAAQILARDRLGEAGLARRELGIEGEAPLPVRVELARFARFLAARDADGLAPDAPEHLLRYLEHRSKCDGYLRPADLLRRRVEEGGCFLLLDGLDEVPQPLRPPLAEMVERLVAGWGGRNRHLVTCRTRAYEGMAEAGGDPAREIRLPSLPSFRLAPFGDAQVARFVAAWSRCLFGAEAESDEGPEARRAESYREELLAALSAHRHIRHLTASPLMLTMLAVVHWNRKRLPEQRAELYKVAVEYLLESRAEQADHPVPLRREALQALALAMFEAPDGVERSRGVRSAAVVVAPVLRVDRGEARRFLDAEALHSGLLVSREEGEVEFWHLSFQEYLAAVELARRRRGWWRVVEGRLYDDRWAEVVLLLAGCLRGQGEEEARELVERVLASRPPRLPAAERGGFLERLRAWVRGDAGLAAKARTVGLVDRILRDLAPYGGDPAAGTGYRRLLEEVLGLFEPGGRVAPEALRIAVGEALGRAGDPRLADAEANRVLIPGGEGVEPFLIGRYPVTVQEFGAFVEAGRRGYLRRELWSEEGWRERERRGWLAPAGWEEQREHGNRPVVGVSFFEAEAYCEWVGGRLPTNAQWERAARGAERRTFPWGEEEPTPEHANFGGRVGGPTPVGIYPRGRTPEGVHDLAGNMWEWCASPEFGASRVCRGGSFGFAPRYLRAAYRYVPRPEKRYRDFGFRVVWCVPGGLG